MKTNLLRSIACGLVILGTASVAAANSATTFLVDSNANSVGGGQAFDTGLYLTAGEGFTVTVPVTEKWNNSGADPFTLESANGSVSQHLLWDRGLYTNVGSLVGEIGNGPFFKVGTDYSATVASAGDLKFVFWDTDAWNNFGSVHATVQTFPAISAVPEPAITLMLAMGLGFVGLSRRRKAV